MTPGIVTELARDVLLLWDFLIVMRHSKDEKANALAISDLLERTRLFPSDVFERLTSSAVGDL